jgi:adenine-specific DNA-methyltransferase
MDKLKMHSPDLSQSNISKIRALFPNCVTEVRSEATDDSGNVKLAIDFDQLKQELSDSIVEGPQERYQLNWPGKREALLTANAPIAKTLRPYREESVNFDTTENLFIEGDNLEALKLLQETYLGNVKMIYIDPPYNTGKDFVYKDDFTGSIEDFFQASLIEDEDRNKLSTNDESNGRFHSDWLTMIYSRLKLAQRLLHEEGAIFISINQKEIANLKSICDEVFGEKNLLCMFSWRTDGNFDNQAKFKYCHEYVLAYAKEESKFPAPLVVDPNVPKDSKIFKTEIRNTIIKNGPKNPVSSISLPIGFPCSYECGLVESQESTWPYTLQSATVKGHELQSDLEVKSGWSSKELLIKFIENDFKPILDSKGQETRFELTKSGAIEAVKVRGKPSHVISSLSGLGGPQKAFNEIVDLGVVFDDYPKPVQLVEYFISMIGGNNFTILDFFAGSGTTAHAVMNSNTFDSGTRKFIAIQLDEKTNESSEARKKGFSFISEITKQRIKLAGEKISLSGKEQDLGFRFLRVDSSNMTEIFYKPDQINQTDMFAQVENIKEDRTDEDLLFQVLLDWGVGLTLPIFKQQLATKDVFFVNANENGEGADLIACFGQNISNELIKALAEKQPLRVVFRDDGFANDSVKINVEQIFKQISPMTDVKSI